MEKEQLIREFSFETKCRRCSEIKEWYGGNSNILTQDDFF